MEEVYEVESIDDILLNLKYLDEIRQNSNHMYFNAYKGLIARGRSFFVYPIDDGIAFAPSRFIGYKENTIEINKDDPGDGRETNKFISRVITHNLERNSKLEKRYVKFCNMHDIDFEDREHQRRYWNYQLLSKELIKKIENFFNT